VDLHQAASAKFELEQSETEHTVRQGTGPDCSFQFKFQLWNWDWLFSKRTHSSF